MAPSVSAFAIFVTKYIMGLPNIHALILLLAALAIADLLTMRIRKVDLIEALSAGHKP